MLGGSTTEEHNVTRIFTLFRNWCRRMLYRPGRVLARFIAPDVRREIRVLSIADIDNGIITGQVRTNNVLYISKGLAEQVDFGTTMSLDIKSMWEWSGKAWGGQPAGTSIVHHPDSRKPK